MKYIISIMAVAIILLIVFASTQTAKVSTRDAQIIDLINNCTELNLAYENALNDDENAAMIATFRELLWEPPLETDDYFALIETFCELMREYDNE